MVVILPVVQAFLIAIAMLMVLLIVYFTVKNGIPPMPTTRYLCEQTWQVFRRFAPPDGTVVEAGAGWGTLAFFLAKRSPQHRLIGLENSLIPLWSGRLLRRLLRINNCRLLRQNMYEFDYRQTNVVVCYLFAGAMRKLSKSFLEQLPDDAIIISIFFAIPHWQVTHIQQCNDLYRTKIYVYELAKQAK
jgi:hypothetical protein